MKKWFQANSTHFIIIGIFFILCFAYFSPAMQGKDLYQSDVLEAKAMAKEIMDVKAATGKGPLWTNSMFGGMPSFQIWVSNSGSIANNVINTLKTVFPNPIDIVLCYLLGAYFLLSVLKMKPWLAAAGAIAFAFTSYNFIYIEAGHSNQAMAISFFAPVLGSILLTFRGRYLLGGLLTAFFLAVEIRCNHIQMTYYLFMCLLILAGFELYYAIASKQLKAFFTSVAYLLGGVILAVGVNAGQLWTTYEYGNESIRGKANLSRTSSKSDTGLGRDYAYNWSQGVGEISTFLVPNMYGGATHIKQLDEHSHVAKALVNNGVREDQVKEIIPQLQQGLLRTYWGEKSSTHGPWYFGCIVIFLYVLGLFIVKGKMKWWILTSTFLFVFLSFGRHFPLISDLFFDYFPLYNKMRAVESILVIPALIIPLLAFVALKQFVDEKDTAKELTKKLLYSVYITGGALVLFMLVPTVFLDFRDTSHQEMVNHIAETFKADPSFGNSIGNALVEDRISLARTDAFRSLVFIVLAFGVMWAILKGKVKTNTAFIALGILILVDMWGVDKRYLNNSNFYDKSVLDQSYQPTAADLQILNDKSLDYRVIDLTKGNPFFDASASYFHKSVGGRHSARLQRYDEMITAQFNGTINEPVLDMLNTKYLILADKASPTPQAIERKTALGNAWFISNISYVKNADEEMKGITKFDPKTTAIVDERFKSQIGDVKPLTDSTANIVLTEYHPDHLVYKYKSAQDVVAVFAEVWYDKGWNAYLDGNQIPYFRANYILRAAKLPSGSHNLAFKFEPTSYLVGDKISMISSLILVLISAIAVFLHFRAKKKTGSV
ncbi:YfhO family protein [Pedobacter foliorum]|uniref:YfhO family protein n=1 Tax=Pedobacter foliorum TaxID=2739058 RepID=UPI001567BE64|nr:YfhO family protein [Pedobacter foliorum]NRF37321.1 hypothetical protein [Pedobacter foliorum]